ncbi:MAG: hypothetical protein IT438_07795 [Phycisphaerales bacterium]|nr:hypothetical protein [Phycisphaerales bacterium]
MIRTCAIILALVINSLAGLSFFLCPSECCVSAAGGGACCVASPDTGCESSCGCCGETEADPGSCCGGDREPANRPPATVCCRTLWPMPADGQTPTQPCSPEDCPLGCCIIVQTGPMLRTIETGTSLVKRASADPGPVTANTVLMSVEPEPLTRAITAATRSGLPESSARQRRARLCIRTI